MNATVSAPFSGRRLAVTCGGTGGHFYPGLSVARTLKAQGGEVLLLISGIHASRQCDTARAAGIEAVELAPMPSPSSPKQALRFLAGLVSGVRCARREMKRFRPEAALGMGSFASLPMLLAARALGVPVFLHDGNARIGRANRMLSRLARFLGTAFPAVNADRVRCRCACTGMPVRPELLAAGDGDRETALAELNRRFGATLTPERRTVLVFGGSQGAQTLNENIPAAFRAMERDDFQVLHLSGAGKLEAAQTCYRDARFPVLVLPGSDAMELFYRAADLVISRAGGSTVAELMLFGKPALLIPYPFAAENHQWANARFLIDADAATGLDNAACSPERARRELESFLDTPERWAERGRNARALARPDASVTLLRRIFPTADGAENPA